MATLPTIYDLGRRPVPGPQRSVAGISPSASGAVSNAVSSLGDELSRIGFEAIDREATAAAKERDALVSDQIRALLYDPQNGFMNLEGGSAVGQRESITARLDGLKSTAMEGLSRPAQKKLQDALQNRIEGAKQSIDAHTSSARKQWIDGASSARIEAAYQDSLVNPAETAAHVATITGELRGQAIRDGWAPERLDLEITKATSKVYNDQAIRIASADPIAAMQYMRDNQDKMLPADVVNLEAKLQPEVKRAVGRAMGRDAALSGVSAEYLSNIRRAESGGNDAAANPNSSATGRYQFTTGTWDALMRQYPNSGLTADGRTSAEQQEVAIRLFTATNAKTLEASGITPTNGNLYAAHFLGAGGAITVLNADPAARMDSLVAPSVIAANQFLENMTAGDFASWADRNGGGAGVGFAEEARGIEGLLDIPDPVKREAALGEYNLRIGVAQAQNDAEKSAARDAAFQMIEAGGNIDDLPLEQKYVLGESAMDALRKHQANKVRGIPTETDPDAYLKLRVMASTNYNQFRSLEISKFRDKLDDGDWEKIIDLYTNPPKKSESASASHLIDVAGERIKGIGIDPNTKNETDANRVAAIKSQLLEWQDQFIKDKGQAPSDGEIDKQVARMLTNVTIESPFSVFGNPLGSNIESRAFELGTGTDPVVIQEKSYPPEVIREVVTTLQGQDIPVTEDTILEAIAGVLR